MAKHFPVLSGGELEVATCN